MAGTKHDAYQVPSSQTGIEVGDTVVCEWSTKGGDFKRIRGQVVAISRDRSKVKVNYLHTSAGRGGFNMESREGWRPMAGARKVKRKEGERTPSEAIGAVVRGMAEAQKVGG